jgi:hypothetical protein
VKPGAFLVSEVARDQLQVIRRGLWILSARLGVLPAKIELAHLGRRELTSGDRPDRLGRSSKASGNEGVATQGPAGGGWRARWKLASLGSRAVRAERRAAAAIDGASASFGTALEAVLQAAIAGVEADEASLSRGRAPSPWTYD